MTLLISLSGYTNNSLTLTSPSSSSKNSLNSCKEALSVLEMFFLFLGTQQHINIILVIYSIIYANRDKIYTFRCTLSVATK